MSRERLFDKFDLIPMFEQQPKILQDKVKSLAIEAINQHNPSGWFEILYAEAEGNSTLVPWAKNMPHPYLQEWLKANSPEVKNHSAVVIGCGLGDDAEALANVGYKVTAFDISATAIDWCKQRFPNSSVTYLVADLLNLAPDLAQQFDLVYECRNIQALPLEMRTQVIQAIASLVIQDGTLLVITRHRENETIPEGPPWALSDTELSQFEQSGLREINRAHFLVGDEIKIEQLRIEYKKLSKI